MTDPAPAPNSSRLAGLDALRGIAAGGVLLHHLGQNYPALAFPVAQEICVDIFLMLSGFVMARTYGHRELTSRQFMTIRYRRLFLTMAIGSTLGLAFKLWVKGPSLDLLLGYLAILAFLPFPGRELFLINVPAWSLFVEVAANALHWTAFRKASTLLLAVLAGTLFALVAVFVIAIGPTGYGSDWWHLGICTVRGLAYYLAGMLIFQRFGDRPLGSPRVALLAFGAILLGFPALPNSVGTIAFILVAPLLLRGSLALADSRAARWAGDLSFPVYAVQLPLIYIAARLGSSPLIAIALIGGVSASIVWLTRPRLKQGADRRAVAVA